MRQAGQSAWEEHERRHNADLQRRRRHFKWKLAIVVLTPPLIFAVSRAVLVGPFDRATSGVMAGLAALVVAAGLASELWGRKSTTEAWRKGAEGEEMTARTLARLPDAFVSLHDLRIPGSRANIDHLVIGPSGVFTVETKHYAGNVDVSWGKASRNGRPMTAVVAQAAGQAGVVRNLLGIDVRPIVCIQGASVNPGLISRGRVGGVLFCPDRRLNKVITSSAGSLSAAEITRLVSLAARSF